MRSGQTSIGWSAAGNPEQVGRALRLFSRLAPSGVMLKIGELAQHAALSRLGESFARHDRVINVVELKPAKNDPLLDQLVRVCDFAGELLKGVQINAPWPSPEAIAGIRERRPGLRIAMLIATDAISALTATNGRFALPSDVADKIGGDYRDRGLVDEVVLDPGTGAGPLYRRRAQPHVIALTKRCPGLAITLAGGIGARTLGDVEPLVRDFPFLSVVSAADPDEVDLYITRAAEMYGRVAELVLA